MVIKHFAFLLGSILVASQTCSNLYGQCGGINWTGSICCASGSYCSVLNPYFSQCVPGSAASATSTTTTTASATTTTTTTQATTTATTTTIVTSLASGVVSTTTTFGPATRTQASYPTASSSVCGSWTLVDNVCLPQYCSNNNESTDCSGCGGSTSSLCTTPISETGKSGNIYDIQTSITNNESFHYSRSTHFGLTSGGACGFGLYGLCSNAVNLTASGLQDTCGPFCAAYPQLCKDPSGTTLRGNFAAPNGNYYTQFKANLGGSTLDNYLSCGECFQLIRTKADGTDYAVGEVGYTVPITLEVIDSCPCSANSKWCCGPGSDHCGEVSDFKYGCPLPNGSIHLDLSDYAMARLQTGNPDGTLTDGVIPTRYKRIPCPNPGNAFLWLRPNAGPYYFALTVVNTAGIGAVVTIEVSGDGGVTWTALIHDPNYTEARPQERYGSWTIPQGSGPFNLPVPLRVTSAAGEQFINYNAITTFAAPANLDANYYYIDLGFQFTK
ncbi:hypothetical protein HK100_001626 [Physocladia obscura]|uniref:Swollenin n=1 Tax=Physocladia obscura TaxID=109957 RepID=A0AAD5SWI3_9FUNG|nr:hypothetical protein HK100_001626 [Physocladia obscura]